MNLRIGIVDRPQTLEVELHADTDEKVLRKSIEVAIEGKSSPFVVQDKRGNELFVSSEKIAFIELGSAEDDRRIGFGV